MSFVGHRQVDSADELKELIMQYATQSPRYYFLRWAHRVSGIEAELSQDFPSPEGQVFNAALELRWKRQGSGYSVLLLSNVLDVAEGFRAIPGNWESISRSVQCHDSKETQFPKGFHFGADVKTDQIQQRYFRDRRTATIHFVALTIKQAP
jgi:hypothetical protein